jgi:TonB-linked SusC/RagA family outer membrane protein
MVKFYLTKRLLILLLMLATANVWAQSRVVTGTVTSGDDGTGLPGVSILEKGTTNGTVTDGDGKYSISLGENATLVFSFVGYAAQEVAVAGRTTLDLVLQTDITALDEIVIVGYGEVQKKDATGAVMNMSTKDFNKGVMASPQDLIVGKFAGVSVTSGNGAPGAGSTIRIRGGSSLTATNDPLIVIDGFPVDGGTRDGLANPLSSINPNDIETFTVLKDASATAIYGSRASNGVIIITTKRGKQGKMQLSYNANVSVSTPVKYLDVLSGDEFRALATEMEESGLFGLNPAAMDLLGDENTDWQKEIFRNAVSHDHSLSASGSFKNVPYRVAYGYTDQQGILKNTDINRNSINVNVNPSLLNDDLKLNFNVTGSVTKSNFGDAAAVGNAVTFDPTQPVRDGNELYGGYFSWLSFTNGAGDPIITNGNSNPVAMLEQTDNKGTANRFLGNFQAEYRLPFLRDLKVNLNLGMDQTITDGYNKVPLNAGFLHATGELIGKNNTYSRTYRSELLDLYGTYSKEAGAHKIDATLGYGWQHFYRDVKNRDEDETRVVENPSRSENFLISFFGRVNYTLNGKYLLTATLRNDGSSKFAKENRWGLFPSVALAWRIKDENFLAGVDALTDLKLRVGYGVTGQQAVTEDYPYLPIYRASNLLAQYQLGDTYYVTQRPQPYDAVIKWEETSTLNLGIDFGLAEDKVTGSVEFFQKETTDLLNNIAIPNGVNFSNFLTTNVGSIDIKGVEITLNTTPIRRPDFTWNVGANFTHLRSEITRLNLTDDPTYPGVNAGNIGVDAFIQNHQVGFPAFSFLVYQQVYDQEGNPVEGLYVDRAGEGGVVGSNIENKYRKKTPVPDFLIGLNSRLTKGQFDFSFSSRLSIGNYVHNRVESGNAYYNNVYTLQHFRNIPSYVTDTEFLGQQQYSDYYIQNASFFKMDNISAGYNFNKVFSDKVKARLSFTVQNAFVITKYKGLDPELDGGIDNNIYPRPRTFLLGLNVNF